jgi:2-methylcitrate dehydratase PrpD
MAKPLHAGRAASAGLLSALLARGGFTAQPSILEAPQGFMATHAGAEPSTEVLASHAGRFMIRDNLFKYHAACYLTHAAIEAAAQLRERHGLDPERIGGVEVRVAPFLLDVCNIEEPKTGLEGKFSLRTTTALALLGEDTGDLATYSDAKMKEPRVVALRDRVRVVPTDGLSPMQARVRIETDGQHVEAEADSGVPESDLEARGARLRRKFMGLAAPVLGAARAAELLDAVSSAERIDSVAELLRLAQPV